MNVGQLLGLDGNSLLLADAKRSWGRWTGVDIRLRAVESYDGFGLYLRESPPAVADGCLHALATLAAQDGGDEVAAAGALAKVLLPGASILAGRLTRSLAHQDRIGIDTDRQTIDQLVASQLWIEVRSFPWRRLARVGGNILLQTRSAVLCELGDAGHVKRVDRAWAKTTCLDAPMLDVAVADAAARDGEPVPLSELTAQEEVGVVLDWAISNGVLTADDGELVLRLLHEASGTNLRATTRGKGNLCGDVLAARVAPALGLAPITVRRRASRAIRALAAAVPSGLCA